MFAARREHVAQVIAPALARGDWVLCDRFTDATFAYQGGGHGVAARAHLPNSNDSFPRDCRPDLTILFDVPIAVSRERLDRAEAKGRDLDKFEREEFAFFERVRNVYLERAAHEPARFRVVNAARPLADVRADLDARARGTCDRGRRLPATTRSRAGRTAALASATPRARRSPRARPGRMRCCSTGRAGIGKRTLALNLARALLCETPGADGFACGTCASCRYVAAGQHPDLQLVEPFVVDDDGEVKVQDPIPVDRIRALIEWVQLTSHRGRAKVAVIVPAEAMNLAAANALLKTLEEPPPSTYLILVVASTRTRAGDAAQPLPAHAGAATRDGRRRTLARATGRGVAAARCWRRPAARRCWRSAWPAREWQAERAVWMQALAKPETLSPVALAARIEAAPKDQRRERLGQVHRLARSRGPPTWARVASGGAPVRNTDFAAAFDRLACAVAPIPLFRYHRTLLRQRALVAHPLQPRLVAEALLIGYRELFR